MCIIRYLTLIILSLSTLAAAQPNAPTKSDSLAKTGDSLSHHNKATQDSIETISRIQSIVVKGSKTQLSTIFNKLQRLTGKPKSKNETAEEYAKRVNSLLLKNDLKTVLLNVKDPITYDAGSQTFIIAVGNVLSSSFIIPEVYIDQTMTTGQPKVNNAVEEDTLIDGVKNGLYSFALGGDVSKTIQSDLELAIIGDIAPAESVISHQTITSSALLDNPLQLTINKHSIRLKHKILVLYHKKTKAILRVWPME